MCHRTSSMSTFDSGMWRLIPQKKKKKCKSNMCKCKLSGKSTAKKEIIGDTQNGDSRQKSKVCQKSRVSIKMCKENNLDCSGKTKAIYKQQVRHKHWGLKLVANFTLKNKRNLYILTKRLTVKCQVLYMATPERFLVDNNIIKTVNQMYQTKTG